MAGQQSTVTLQNYVRRLEELAQPLLNDRRHADYVRYINGFLEVFGDERVYLVGSTGENSKLRWSTDSGDADFIFVSGRLGIPVANIEPREGMPVYVWIRADNLNREICGGLVDERYLCPEMLRTLHPRLFTILRGIYLYMTATRDGQLAQRNRFSITGTDSKVGLASEEFRNLTIDGEDHQPKRGPKPLNKERSKEFSTYLHQRWKGVRSNPTDSKLLRRIMKIFTLAKVPGSKGTKFGLLANMAAMMEAMLQRPPLDEESVEQQMPIIFDNALGIDEQDNENCTKVRATYTEKSSKDFVPALRVIGVLPCMDTFMRRVENASWPSQELAEEIYKTDVFVVSRRAPKDANAEKDFCLSFNLAEIKLSKKMPPVAKKVFLVLKSYLKGILAKKFKENNRSMKLKTYHMKMVMFWLCEQNSAELWSDIFPAIQTALDFLLCRLSNRCLEHYFVLSNLFVGFEEEDYSLLFSCLNKIRADPIRNIEHLLEMDKELVGVTYLSQAEVECLTKMKEDGGGNKTVDKLEEACIDFIRGFNDARHSSGDARIREAVLKVVDIFLEDEKQRLPTRSNPNAPATSRGGGLQGIAGLMNAFITNGGSGDHSSREASQRMDLLVGLGSLFPQGRTFLQHCGGKTGLQNVIQFTSDDTVDNGRELREATDRFLSCSDDMEDALALELKQRIAAYFFGRVEKL